MDEGIDLLEILAEAEADVKAGRVALMEDTLLLFTPKPTRGVF